MIARKLKQMLAVIGVSLACANAFADQPVFKAPLTHYRNVTVDGLNVFYREAGDASKPTIILLHGFPGSSFANRKLIPLLADKYHVIAPDLIGFGYSSSPPRSKFKYTFNNIEKVMDDWTQVMGLKHYVLYVCDFGATVGFRLALAHPERVLAIVSQNGNAYQEGIKGSDWAPIQAAWKNPTAANRAAVRNEASPEQTKYQWLAGVPDPSEISPDTYTLASLMQSKGDNMDAMADLLTNFATEETYYPKYQAYFRKYQPPMLAVWGRNDPFFLWPAAEAFKRDLPKAEVHFYPASHFALETFAPEIADAMRDFLARNLPASTTEPTSENPAASTTLSSTHAAATN